jgi:hypothetical protein
MSGRAEKQLKLLYKLKEDLEPAHYNDELLQIVHGSIKIWEESLERNKVKKMPHLTPRELKHKILSKLLLTAIVLVVTLVLLVIIPRLHRGPDGFDYPVDMSQVVILTLSIMLVLKVWCKLIKYLRN